VRNYKKMCNILQEITAMCILECVGSTVAGTGDGECQTEDRSCGPEKAVSRGRNRGPGASE